MDKRIFMLLGAIIIIGGIIFLIQRLLSRQTACTGVTMNLSSEQIIKGDSLLFEDKTEGANNWVWSFGDNIGMSDQQHGRYLYTEEGSFWVKLLVNDQCSDSVLVTVFVPDRDTSMKSLMAINAPATVNAGDKVQFKAQGGGATKWMWQFGESGKVDVEIQNPYYSYNLQGTYTIKLSTDNSKYPATKIIKVLPKRLVKVPSKKPVGGGASAPAPTVSKLPPPASKKEIQTKLQSMVNSGGWNQNDKDWFSAIMVNGIGTKATWDIKDVAVETLQDVNSEFVFNPNKYEIVSVDYDLDKEYNLISVLKIKAKKK